MLINFLYTKVKVGAEDPLQIVCGAPNVASRTKSSGSYYRYYHLPCKWRCHHNEKAKIRGVESYGMICAEDEIGLGESHNGILVLKTVCNERERRHLNTSISTTTGFMK
jgi:phenylalanyl-tRNA synthetase beta chain